MILRNKIYKILFITINRAGLTSYGKLTSSDMNDFGKMILQRESLLS